MVKGFQNPKTREGDLMRRSWNRICGAFILFPLAFCTISCERRSPTKAKGPTIEERLVGRWKRSWIYNDVTYVGIIDLKDDRSFERKIYQGDEPDAIAWIKGHYFVEEDMLYMIADDSSDPSVVGDTYEYQIVLKDGKIYLVYLGQSIAWEKVESS